MAFVDNNEPRAGTSQFARQNPRRIQNGNIDWAVDLTPEPTAMKCDMFLRNAKSLVQLNCPLVKEGDRRNQDEISTARIVFVLLRHAGQS